MRQETLKVNVWVVSSFYLARANELGFTCCDFSNLSELVQLVETIIERLCFGLCMMCLNFCSVRES